jgi:hypothetical protein
MTHCCNEKSEVNARCFSSQVFGESTTQTVMIRSIAFMPISSGAKSTINNISGTKPAGTRFHEPVNPERVGLRN